MATLSSVTYTKVGRGYGSATAGQAAGYAAASGGGDKLPLSGLGIIVGLKTTGTASTVTFDSVRPSDYGTDVNITVTMAATDEQEIFIENSDRFAGTGADAGLVNVTYSSVVGLSIKSKIVPG